MLKSNIWYTLNFYFFIEIIRSSEIFIKVKYSFQSLKCAFNQYNRCDFFGLEFDDVLKQYFIMHLLMVTFFETIL